VPRVNWDVTQGYTLAQLNLLPLSPGNKVVGTRGRLFLYLLIPLLVWTTRQNDIGEGCHGHVYTYIWLETYENGINV
jgi:hypothetical protein